MAVHPAITPKHWTPSATLPKDRVSFAGVTAAEMLERARSLVPLFAEQMSEYRQPIHAVYYRNSQLALRIQCFLDFLQARLAG